MGRLYQCGFEMNRLINNVEALEVQDAGSNANHYISSAVVYSGAYAGRLVPLVSGGYPQFRYPLSTTDDQDFVILRFRLYVHAFANVAAKLLDYYTTGYALRVHIILNTNGSIVLNDEDGTIGTSSAGDIVVDTWYRLELKLDKTGAGGAHIVELKKNGDVLLTSSTRNISTNIGYIYNGFDVSATAGDYYLDDIALNDDSGSFQNDYPGDGKIIYAFPNKAGDNAQWTRNTGSLNYANADDPPFAGGADDATTYNYSNTVNQIDDFNVACTQLSYTQDFSGVVIPTGWTAFGNSTWAYNGATAQETVVGSEDPCKLLYTDVVHNKNRTVVAKVKFDAIGTGDDRVGITVLGQSSDGKGYNLVLHGNNALAWLNDGIAWGSNTAIAPNVGETWWFKAQYLNGTFSGKAWKVGDSEPAWMITWTITPSDAFQYSGLTGNGSSATSRCTYDDFNIITSGLSITDTINVVAVNVRYTCDNASAPASFVVRCKATSGGTVEESAAITPNSTSWFTNSNTVNVMFAPLTMYDLPGASTTAWTASDLDTAQIGYRISTGNTNNVRISTVWMSIDYTYVAPTNKNVDLTDAAYLQTGPQRGA